MNVSAWQVEQVKIRSERRDALRRAAEADRLIAAKAAPTQSKAEPVLAVDFCKICFSRDKPFRVHRT
jgi:hypothetical protein